MWLYLKIIFNNRVNDKQYIGCENKIQSIKTHTKSDPFFEFKNNNLKIKTK
jgi:hypothetical protein